jgi:hypothetical protein
MSPRTSFRAIALRRLGSASAAEIQGTVQETAYLRGTRGTYFHGWYRTFILQVMKKLEQADYLKSQPAKNEKNEEVPLYRLRLEKIFWKPGDGESVKADVIKRRSYKEQAPRPNEFFQRLYKRDFAKMKRLRGEDHTGQLNTDQRIDREAKFREGEISALFCSPTMELGIDS